MNNWESILKGKSSVELRGLAQKATKLADDLSKKQPTYALALANGVKEVGYPTVRYGYVSQYTGEAIVTMDDGSRWRCVGHKTRGNAEYVSRDAFIEFIPLHERCDA